MDSSLRVWRLGLVIVIALLYASIGLAAGGLIAVLGLGGAVLIGAALAVSDRSGPIAVALLLAGAIPLAALTWWSLVTPLLAVLCLLLGRPRTSRRTHSAPSRPATWADRPPSPPLSAS